MTTVTIAGRRIGHGEPCWIIAEAGVNHNQDLQLALEMVEAAAEAGADAVKFQSFVTEEIATRHAPKAAYQERTTRAATSQFELLKQLELPESFYHALMERARAKRILFLSTPYDGVSGALLDRLGVAALKIASTDTTNLPLLQELAGLGRPILLSTGMCSLGEVEEAVATIRGAGNQELVLLQCTAQYPTPLAEANLRAMATMAAACGCPVGFSDHTQGLGASPWAVAAGACVIEKHFTLDRRLPGPDQSASLEPGELRELVRVIRQVEAALGDGIKRPMPCELATKRTHQKSLVVRRPLATGEVVTREHVACKRPGTGLAPRNLERVVGRRAMRPLQVDDILDWSMLSQSE